MLFGTLKLSVSFLSPDHGDLSNGFQHMLVLLRECWELFALAIGLKPQMHFSHHG